MWYHKPCIIEIQVMHACHCYACRSIFMHGDIDNVKLRTAFVIKKYWLKRM